MEGSFIVDIDVIIPWVNGDDKAWLKERTSYSDTHADGTQCRYREWGLLKYWFRGIEKNLPWIRTVYFITCGHLPDWLNLNCPKLKIVFHKDYIPDEYLPTFSSHVIELNVHRIESLSEHFIYANDDTYFVSPMKETDFFKNGLPRDSLIENITYQGNHMIDKIINNDIGIINNHFNKSESRNTSLHKWFSLKYRKKILNNIFYARIRFFIGFQNPHLPNPFLKKTFLEVWEKEKEILDDTCKNKFRTDRDVNQWLMRYWQLVNGEFVPDSLKKGNFFSIQTDDEAIKDALLNQRYKMVCINDDVETIDFEKEQKFLTDCFEKILPEKSNFEK